MYESRDVYASFYHPVPLHTMDKKQPTQIRTRRRLVKAEPVKTILNRLKRERAEKQPKTTHNKSHEKH